MDRRLFVVTFFLSLTSLALSDRNGNFFDFGAFGGHQPEPTTSPPSHRLQVDPNSLPTDEQRCSLGRVHSNSIPRGQTHVDSIHSIGYHFTIQGCAQLCCQLGPTQCQYAWIFENRCFSIACPDNPEQCTPTPFLNAHTTLVELSWPEGGQEGDIAENQPSTETVTMTTTTGAAPHDNSSIATNSTSTMVTQPTTVSMATAEEEDTSPTPPSTHAPSPTTHSPTTHTSTTHSPTSHPSTTHSPFTTTATELPTVTHPLSQKTITVAATGDTEVTLPENRVQIFTSTWPEPRYRGEFTYRWEKLFGPSAGTVYGENNKDIELTGLEAGVYGLRLTVQSEFGDWGETAVNVTVHAMPRTNSPPTAVISPMNNITIVLPVDSVILDASSSTDDGGTEALSFHWEEVQGPIRDSTSASEEALLELHDLRQGNYRYKLTVTDADGAQSVAFANVTVLPEKDYPPTANAGKSLLIHLPKNEVYLYGNRSTDDKGTLQYSWQQLRGHPVDMEGSQTAILHVTQLAIGAYEFELTVTDSAGQFDVASVTVDVQPEKTTPPVADAGGNYTVVFPLDNVVLDGSRSNNGDNDDNSASSFIWTQVNGPTDIHLSGEGSERLTLQGLHISQETGSPTPYQFKLTVTNHRNLSDSDVATVFYKKDKHIPPQAVAGPNITIHLPETTAILDGSQSHDNFGIDSYHWERSSNSPAAGMAVNQSDHQPVLILSNLVNGTYHFVLTITNRNGQKAYDNVTLTVLPNPNAKDILRVYVEDDPWKFTQEDLHDLGDGLGLMLNNHEEAHQIIFQGVYSAEPNVMVEFYATNRRGDQVLNATSVYEKLTAKGQDYHFTRFHIIGVEMKVCQLYCSGHGVCNVRTKKCECNNFWMENPFSAHFGRKETNCEWSVFYVVLVALISVLVLVFLVWLCCCCCLRRRRMVRTKRRVRYAILDSKDEESAHMLPKDSSSYQQSSLMVSESDTEEEVLFDTAKKGQPAPAPLPTVKNNKLTAGEKYGKNSSLANSVIPK